MDSRARSGDAVHQLRPILRRDVEDVGMASSIVFFRSPLALPVNLIIIYCLQMISNSLSRICIRNFIRLCLSYGEC